MTLEDILHEDKIAAPVWAAFTLSALFKPTMAVLNGDMHGTVQTFISILPALCGAYLGFRHMQSISAFKTAKLLAEKERMHAEHALEREKLAAARGFRELPILHAVKNPASDEPTVDLP